MWTGLTVSIFSTSGKSHTYPGNSSNPASPKTSRSVNVPSTHTSTSVYSVSTISETQLRVKHIVEYIQFHCIKAEGKYSMVQIETLLRHPKHCEEKDHKMKICLDIQEDLEKLWSAIGTSAYEWFEHNCNNHDDRIKKMYFPQFYEHLNKLQNDLFHQDFDSSLLQTYFLFITGDVEEPFVDHANLDMAIKKIHLHRDKLVKLNKTKDEIKLLASFMKKEHLYLGGGNQIVEAMKPLSELEKLLHKILIQYDAYVEQHGPLDVSGDATVLTNSTMYDNADELEDFNGSSRKESASQKAAFSMGGLFGSLKYRKHAEDSTSTASGQSPKHARRRSSLFGSFLNAFGFSSKQQTQIYPHFNESFPQEMEKGP